MAKLRTMIDCLRVAGVFAILTTNAQMGSADTIYGLQNAAFTQTTQDSQADFLATQRTIAQFQINRANQLISKQPDLIQFLRGTSKGVFNAKVTGDNGRLQFANKPDRPVWVRLNASWVSYAGRKTRYGLGAMGIHRKIRPNFLVGALFEFDHLGQSHTDIKTKGAGWMAGPYFVARSLKHPLYFEGRFLYNKIANSVRPLGTYVDSFDTERFLAQAKIAGRLNFGTTVVKPNVKMSYTVEKQNAYVDGLGHFMPDQTIKLGAISLSADFTKPVPVKKGDLKMTGGLNGIWTGRSYEGPTATVMPVFEGGRAKAKFGLQYRDPNGASQTVGMYYDGIGVKNYESYGIDVQFQVNF